MDGSDEWEEDFARALLLGDKGWGECKVLGGLLELASQIGDRSKLEAHTRKRN